MTDIYLQEGGPPVVLPIDDSDGEALATSAVVDAARVGGGEWEISAGTKVGVAAVGEFTIWIAPKLEIARILFMLGYAQKPGWRTESVALAETPDLVPALADAFVEQAGKALNLGLLQGYTEVEDSTTVLRGRLRDNDQVRQRFGIAMPLLVRFDDYLVDIAENQMLRGATELLLRLPGVRAPAKAKLRRLRRVLADITPVARGAMLPSWHPNRLNERYHVALWLAELLLKKNAVDQAPGTVHIGGFLVDMAKVYEDFLTAALTNSFRTHGGRTQTQDRHFLDVDQKIVMKPDLVWYLDGEPAAVVDAKYKAEKPAGFPDADLYQMLAYSTALQLDDGHLVYAEGNAQELTYTVRHVDITIHAHTLDLSNQPTVLLAQVDALAEQIAATRARFSAAI